MLTLILLRFHRRISAATLGAIASLSANYRLRRWRRDTLRSMRKRSRE